MSGCIDPQIGVMLHAYELNALTEAQSESFEAHLLKCDYCFRRVSDFDREAKLLALDPEVRELVISAGPGGEGKDHLMEKIRRYIWPDVPLIFRPALAYLLVLIMIYPVYLGLRGRDHRDIRSIRNTVYLSDLRSVTQRPVLTIDHGEGAVMIYYDEAETDRAYTLVVESDSGREVFRKPNFVRFDRSGNSLVIISRDYLPKGKYLLRIVDPRAGAQKRPPEYFLEVD